MSIKKLAIHSGSLLEFETLNVPSGREWDIINTSILKTASINKMEIVDIGGFDIRAAIQDNPEHLFVKVFAIKKDEVNDNGDAFSEPELIKSANTFIGVPVFVNHQNDDIEKARGKVVHAWYDKNAGGIFIICMVDRVAYPKLARGVEEKIISGTSMGAQVGYSVCSLCHNKSHTAEDFCSHVKERKNKKFSGKMKCRYHESDCKPSDDCPVCNAKKGSSVENHFKEARIFEHNYDIRFIENSFVVNPACHDCGVCDILRLDKVQSKIASMMSTLKTAASNLESKVINENILKTAGQKEIIDLNDAMTKLERVARSMMAQKQKIQLEYVSDIVESLADIQSITDELIQMGYAQLPSPSDQEIAFGAQSPASPVGNQAQQTQPQNMTQNTGGMTGSMPMNPTGQMGPPQTGNAGNQVGTITKPSFSANASSSEKEFIKTSENIKDKIDQVEHALGQLFDKIANRTKELTNNKTVYQSSDKDYKVLVVEENNNYHVAEYKGDVLLRLSNVDVFSDDIREIVKSDPQKFANLMLEKIIKESGLNMASQEKTASGVDKSQIEVTTEAQLDQHKTSIGGRQENPPEGITESKEQLGGSEKKNDTTSESPQVRRGTYETITEDQLASITDGYMVRWSDYPEVITEGQWDDTSRAVRAALPSDWNESVTQKQLISLRDNHSWVDPNFVTERQLAEQKDVLPNDATSRFAKTNLGPKDLLKSAMDAVSDAISKYSISPQQISQAISRMTSSPQSQIKAARLSLLNAIPRMIEARSAECKRRNYFAKIAASSSFSPIDGLLSAIGDNLSFHKADDLIDAVRFVASDARVMKKAESEALSKISSRNDESVVDVDRSAALRQAFAEMNRSDDGIYRVCGAIKEDLGVSVSDRPKFIQAVDSFARSQVIAETILTDIDVDVEAGTFEATVKEASALTDAEKTAANKIKVAGCPPWLKDRNGCEEEEKETEDKEASSNNVSKTARSAARNALLKQSQMMGGQMGGGMDGGAGGAGGGMGAGSTMPQPPGAEQPPVESFTEDPGEDLMNNEGDDGEAKPPGATCPACGTDDVDVAGGKNHCNSCGLDYLVKIDIESLNGWPGVIDGGEGPESSDDKDSGLEDDSGGEGFSMPNQEPASIPVAAMTRLTPKALKKIAESGIKLGEISPLTGSNNTLRLSDNRFMCLDTGCKYEVALRGGKGKDTNLYAEWRWIDRRAERECTSCRRQKTAFVKALKGVGLTEAQFDASQAMDKAKTIMAMQQKGLLKQIKVANKSASIVEQFKAAFSVPADKFPIEGCIEKLARRYGENAIALSGPCEGSNLADCVCNKLKTAGFYSDGLAVKLASIWSDQDGTIECWEDYIRSGLNAKQAATVCEQIRRKYSQAPHFLADALTDENDVGSNMHDDMGGIGDADPHGDSSSGIDPNSDPFADSSSDIHSDSGLDNPDVGGTSMDNTDPSSMSPEPSEPPEMDNGDGMIGDLPLSILDALKQLNEQVINTMQGKGGMPSDPMGGMTDPMGGPSDSSVVSVEMTTDDPSQIGEVAGDAMETAVDAVEDASMETGMDNEIEDGESPIDDGSSPDEPFGDGSEGDDNEETKSPFGDSQDDDGSEESDDGSLEKEGNDIHMAASNEKMLKEAESLRRGRIVGNHKVNMDVSSILNILQKKADQTSLVQKNVQDDSDIGTVSNGGTIGKEDKFKADKPDVPTKGSGATMGHESKDLHPGDSKPTVFTGKAEMGHESEQGYTSEKTNQHTGGEDGAGKSASSTRRKAGDLADRIIAAQQKKVANDKKLDSAKPVSEDGDIGTYSGNKDLSTTQGEDKIQPFGEGDSKEIKNVPERGEGSFMGHEKDTIGIVPKPDNSAPQIPAGGGKNSKYDTKWDAEKQTSIKGTVIAQGDEKSKVTRKEAAVKLAGRMIERGIIKADQLMSKIAELERYEIPQMQDLEKAMFATVSQKTTKGLNAVSNGSEKTVVIADTSKFTSGEQELKTKIQSLFRLQQRNDAADSDPNSDLYKTYKK